MQIQVLFFGVAKDLTGEATATAELPDGSTVQNLFDFFAARHPALRDIERSLVLAVNTEFSRRDCALNENDEVAFLPPVSGGAVPWTQCVDDADGHFFALTREPIDTRALVARITRPYDGAVATFEGVVRNNTNGRPTLFLEYECYEAMAIRLMAEIGRAIVAERAVSRIAMVHRLGRLEIGAASVVIVASAPHRKPAFEACIEGINRLKKLVPVWKKEHFANGEVWVEGEWDASVLER